MKKFKKIYIEITNNCNLSCSFCHKSKRPKAWVRTDDFTKIIGQIKTFTSHIALHVLGEPLLHPELGLLLTICHENRMAVNLTTNGTLLPKRQALLLATPALRQINISLHSAVEMMNEQDLSDYLCGIFSFIGQAQSSSTPPFYISLRLWNVVAVEEGGNSHNNEIILRKIEKFFSLPIKLDHAKTPGHGIPLAPNIFLSQNPRFSWPHAPAADLGDKGFCRGLRDHVAILVDGSVVPCCLDAEADICLGNIHDHTLKEILLTPRATALYNGFSQRRLEEPLCRRCTFRQNF